MRQRQVGAGTGGAPAESFQTTYFCHTDSHHHGPRDLKLICCLAACLDRISEDSHVLPDCLWSTADGSQDWASDEKWLVSWSVRPTFELGVGGVYGEMPCIWFPDVPVIKKTLWEKKLTPKNKPLSPLWFLKKKKKNGSQGVVEPRRHWNKSLCYRVAMCRDLG